MMNRTILLIFSIIILAGIQACSDDGQDGHSNVAEQDFIQSIVITQPEIPELAPAEKDRALKVGVIGAETGDSAFYGLRVLQGINMAARTFNANGGINGQAIEVIHYDTKGDPGLTDEAVGKLIEQRVLAIFAAPTGWSTFASTHLANASRTIFISVGSRRRIGKSGPYIFRFSLADESAIDTLIEYSIQQAGYKNYALVTASDYDYSLDISSLFRRSVAKYGGNLTLVADTYDTFSGKRSVVPVVNALSNSIQPLDAVIYTGGEQQAAQLAMGIKRVGLKLPLVGGEDLHTKAYLTNARAAARGGLLYASFAAENNSPQVVKFIQDYKKQKQAVPDRFVALAYDGFMLLAEAIKTAASIKSTEVRDAIININFNGITGSSHFSSQGSPLKQAFIYRIEAGKIGEKFVLLKHNRQAER